MLDVCGTVIWEAASAAGFLIEVAARLSARSLGSFGVGEKRSGWAICASRVSYGKNAAFGRPRESQRYATWDEGRYDITTSQVANSGYHEVLVESLDSIFLAGSSHSREVMAQISRFL